jgi:hypothetical protein
MSSTASFWPGSRAGVTNIGQRIGYGISYDHFADVQRSHERPGNLRVPFVQGKSSWAHVSYRNNRVISGVGFCPFCNWNSNRRDRLGPLRIPIRRFVDFRQPPANAVWFRASPFSAVPRDVVTGFATSFAAGNRAELGQTQYAGALHLLLMRAHGAITCSLSISALCSHSDNKQQGLLSPYS